MDLRIQSKQTQVYIQSKYSLNCIYGRTQVAQDSRRAEGLYAQVGLGRVVALHYR